MQGKDLHKARISLSFSIRQFSELTGIDRRVLKRLEQMNLPLSQDQIFLVKPYVGVPLTYATRAKLIRDRSGMTQAELGAILERSPRWVSSFEAGLTEPTEAIKAVLHALAGE